jgi:spore coat polysaccharide biosynthesis protein SpsF
MTSAALRRAAEIATSAYDREHATPYLYRPNNPPRIGYLANSIDLSFLRWTVDTEGEFRLVEAIYDALYLD